MLHVSHDAAASSKSLDEVSSVAVRDQWLSMDATRSCGTQSPPGPAVHVAAQQGLKVFMPQLRSVTQHRILRRLCVSIYRQCAEGVPPCAAMPHLLLPNHPVVLQPVQTASQWRPHPSHPAGQIIYMSKHAHSPWLPFMRCHHAYIDQHASGACRHTTHLGRMHTVQLRDVPHVYHHCLVRPVAIDSSASVTCAATRALSCTATRMLCSPAARPLRFMQLANAKAA